MQVRRSAWPKQQLIFCIAAAKWASMRRSYTLEGSREETGAPAETLDVRGLQRSGAPCSMAKPYVVRVTRLQEGDVTLGARREESPTRGSGCSCCNTTSHGRPRSHPPLGRPQCHSPL
jgi:hypothetical protein